MTVIIAWMLVAFPIGGNVVILGYSDTLALCEQQRAVVVSHLKCVPIYKGFTLK